MVSSNNPKMIEKFASALRFYDGSNKKTFMQFIMLNNKWMKFIT